jgi:hypothetical protein
MRQTWKNNKTQSPFIKNQKSKQWIINIIQKLIERN